MKRENLLLKQFVKYIYIIGYNFVLLLHKIKRHKYKRIKS